MFDFLKKKPPVEPPTTKQINYARKLGIPVTPSMTKWELSNAIDEAIRNDPKLQRQREHIEESKKIKEYGAELVAAEKQWEAFIKSVGYMLAVYVRGKNTIVDVLHVYDAYLDGKRKIKLKLTVAAPKLMKDREEGDWLIWDREFELPVEKLLYSEPLHAHFDTDGIRAYQAVVKRGLKIAKKM